MGSPQQSEANETTRSAQPRSRPTPPPPDNAGGQRLYRALAEAMPALVLTTSADGEVVYCNQELLDYCGVERTDLQGSSWVDLIHPDDVASGTDRWLAEVRTLKPFTAEYRIRRHDGAYRWYLTRTAPLRNADDEVEGWVGVSVDVHDRREAEDDLRQMSEDLRRASSAKDDFLALVSHELRTPITTIYGNVHVLRRSTGHLAPGQLNDAMADIEQEAVRLQQLIDNMFVLARIDEHGQQSVEPIALRRALDKAVLEHSVRYPETCINIHDRTSGQPVLADETYLQHVIRNLLINAEKFSPPSAPIDVHIDWHNDTTVAVRVCDGGSGIKDDVDRIFEPFYRSPERIDIAPGAGIGLAVARRLVEAQGGIIWARNREQGGAELGFTLPIEPEDDA